MEGLGKSSNRYKLSILLHGPALGILGKQLKNKPVPIGFKDVFLFKCNYLF
jgi:hypothetical protein